MLLVLGGGAMGGPAAPDWAAGDGPLYVMGRWWVGLVEPRGAADDGEAGAGAAGDTAEADMTWAAGRGGGGATVEKRGRIQSGRPTATARDV